MAEGHIEFSCHPDYQLRSHSVRPPTQFDITDSHSSDLSPIWEVNSGPYPGRSEYRSAGRDREPFVGCNHGADPGENRPLLSTTLVTLALAHHPSNALEISHRPNYCLVDEVIIAGRQISSHRPPSRARSTDHEIVGHTVFIASNPDRTVSGSALLLRITTHRTADDTNENLSSPQGRG